MKATAMDMHDLEMIIGQCYACRYPNFEDGLEYRRFRFEGTAYRETGVFLIGIDLDTGKEGKWSPRLVTRLEPIPEPALVPGREYPIRHGEKEGRMYVYSCYPAGGDYRITGKVNGRFVAALLSEIEVISLGSGVRHVV